MPYRGNISFLFPVILNQNLELLEDIGSSSVPHTQYCLQYDRIFHHTITCYSRVFYRSSLSNIMITLFSLADNHLIICRGHSSCLLLSIIFCSRSVFTASSHEEVTSSVRRHMKSQRLQCVVTQSRSVFSASSHVEVTPSQHLQCVVT